MNYADVTKVCSEYYTAAITADIVVESTRSRLITEEDPHEESSEEHDDIEQCRDDEEVI